MAIGRNGTNHKKAQEDAPKSSKPLILHRSTNGIIVQGTVNMFKKERVSYISSSIRLYNISYCRTRTMTFHLRVLMESTGQLYESRSAMTSTKSFRSMRSSRRTFQPHRRWTTNVSNSFRHKHSSRKSTNQSTLLVKSLIEQMPPWKLVGLKPASSLASAHLVDQSE